MNADWFGPVMLFTLGFLFGGGVVAVVLGRAIDALWKIAADQERQIVAYRTVLEVPTAEHPQAGSREAAPVEPSPGSRD